MGKAQEHQSRPLNSLKDPSAFGPPPKNVNYHGGAAVPDRITPDRRGLGPPLTTQELQAMEQVRHEPDIMTDMPKPPPVPFRANSTGLSTQNLPSPPTRRVQQNGQILGTTAINPAHPPKPSLPPRLPPRQNTKPIQSSPSPPPPYSPAVPVRENTWQTGSQGFANRLAAAGVSVPGLGIQRSDSATQEATASPGQPRIPMSDLQSRFGRMTTQSPPSETSLKGTSLADKQAAVKTAQSFREDPSSVSLADARAAASTADNFRQRHGDQVASGWRSANALNQKYDIGRRINSQTEDSSPGDAAPVNSGIGARKPTLPPPPKRMAASDSSSEASPPIIPLSSKPKW